MLDRGGRGSSTLESHYIRRGVGREGRAGTGEGGTARNQRPILFEMHSFWRYFAYERVSNETMQRMDSLSRSWSRDLHSAPISILFLVRRKCLTIGNMMLVNLGKDK